MRHTWKVLALVPALFWAGSQGVVPARGQQIVGPSCAACQPCLPQPPRHHCPPKFCHVQEGPPHIHYKHGCPRPVCDPCQLPHYGYFQPCWRPSPFGPDWSHCPELPPAALVEPCPDFPPPITAPSPGSPMPSTKSNGAEKLPPPMPSKLSYKPSVKY